MQGKEMKVLAIGFYLSALIAIGELMACPCPGGNGPSQKCGENDPEGKDVFVGKLTQQQKDEILKMHNDVRSKVALGNQEGERGITLPQASNMNKLYWCEGLATTAQWAADKCDYDNRQHTCRPCRGNGSTWHGKAGENIARAASTVRSESLFDFTQLAENGWYEKEVIHVSEKEINEFPQSQRGDPVIGHYTQMIWAKTECVGCGAVSYHNENDDYHYQHILFCQYGKTGNYLGKSVYNKQGRPASNCPEGYVSNTKTGLCERNADKGHTEGQGDNGPKNPAMKPTKKPSTKKPYGSGKSRNEIKPPPSKPRTETRRRPSGSGHPTSRRDPRIQNEQRGRTETPYPSRPSPPRENARTNGGNSPTRDRNGPYGTGIASNGITIKEYFNLLRQQVFNFPAQCSFCNDTTFIIRTDTIFDDCKTQLGIDIKNSGYLTVSFSSEITDKFYQNGYLKVTEEDLKILCELDEMKSSTGSNTPGHRNQGNQRRYQMNTIFYVSASYECECSSFKIEPRNIIDQCNKYLGYGILQYPETLTGTERKLYNGNLQLTYNELNSICNAISNQLSKSGRNGNYGK